MSSEELKQQSLINRYKNEIAPHLPRSEIYKEKLDTYKSSSLKNHIHGLNHFTDFLNEYDIDVENIEANQFEWWYTYLNNRVAKSTSKNYFYAAIKYLRYTGLLDEKEYERSGEDTYKNFRNIRTEKQKIADDEDKDLWFSRDQMESMVNEADIFRDKILIRFLYHTGARAIETTNVRVGDVDLVERSIEIRTAKRDDGHRRTIYYPTDLVEPMQDWITDGRHDYVYSDTSDYLFLGRSSKQLNENWIRNKVVELAKKAGFQEVLYRDSRDAKQYLYTTHEFRRGYIIRHLQEQMPTPYLKEIAGHKQLSTTEKYISKADSVLKQAQKDYRPD